MNAENKISALEKEQREIKLDDEDRQECEIWTRVMGYFRPLSVFNIGKKSEYAERRCFSEKKATERFMSISAE